MYRQISHIVIASFSACFVAAPLAWSGPVVVEDFEGGAGGFAVTSPGFTLEHRDTGGNLGGYVQMTDLARSGSGGFADAPGTFLGNLSTYDAVQWDLFRPDGALVPGTLLLAGPGGEFLFERSGTETGAWVGNRAPLQDPSAWTRVLGDGTLAESLGDVTRLGFLLEVVDGTGVEAGLDNVRLVPGAGGTVIPLPAALPATLAAVGPLIAAAAVRRWRRKC